MRFAAATLMAGLVFLAVALFGFGSAPLGPQDYPQAIRLSGISATEPSAPGVAVPLPDTQATPTQVSGSAPAVAVGHNVVSSAPHAAPRPATPLQPVSGTTPCPAASTDQVQAPVFEIAPAPPDADHLAVSRPRPVAHPTPSATPSPSPLRAGAVAAPSPTKTGLLRTIP